MAALATRFVRLAIEPGFAARFRAAGSDAGREFARAFRLSSTAALAGFNPRVRVQLDVDSFNRPNLPPVNLRVGFDMSQAVAAGRRAAAVANAAAGPINLNVNGGGGIGSMVGLINMAGSAVRNLSINFTEITSNMTQAASSAGSFGNSLTDLGGPIGQALGIAKVVFIIASLPAIAMAATAALYTLGGALGSLPAVTVGLGFSVGALGLGFMGLGEHLRSVPKAGGGAAKSMSAVNNAARSLARAQRELLKATTDIDKARAGEIERIDDLGRALRGAVIDEADAVAAVAEARTALAEARGTGDPNAIGAAERALNRANLTLDESRDKVGDLAADKAKADRDGVEGSDAMLQAYERQRDAVEQVKAAEEALAEARKSGGGGGMAQQLMQLAPAAEEVVRKLKELRPAFTEVRLAVQQALFQGVAPELQRLADAWKQPLKSTLVDYASTFNRLFQNLGESARNPGFIANITAGADTVRRNLAKIGTAITGPLVDAFGRLSKAAAPFIDMLGDKLTGMIESFSDWIKSADESGDLNKFFEDASYYLGLIWDIGSNAFGIIGEIFGILFDTKNQGGTKPWLEGFNEQLIAVREWLKDPDNRQRIKDFIDRIGDIVAKAEAFTLWVTEEGLPALSDLWKKIDAGREFISDMIDKVQEWWDKWKGFRDFILAPFSFAEDMFDGIVSAMRWAINRAIDLFNSLNLGIKIGSNAGGISVSGTARNLPTGIAAGLSPRKFAAGGVVRATPGGVSAIVAEAGKDEAISPIDVLQRYVGEAVTAAFGQSAAGGAPIVVESHVYLNGKELERTVVETIVKNPDTVAKASQAGSKRRGYAG